MKVLLVGNDKLVTESLIKRFLLEDDKVIILSSRISTLPQSIEKKITYYNLDISSEACQNVFSVHFPDLVIYFNHAQKDCIHDLVIDEVNGHIDCFLNIHGMASYFRVKKFVYISTTDLYAHDIMGPDESSKVETDNLWESAHQLCEQHMMNIRKVEKMGSLIIRTSTLFGPAQQKENSEIALYVDELLYGTKHEELKKTAQSFYSRDYIYIEDFTGGVYKCATSSEKGIMNIASGKKYRIAEIFELIDELYKEISVNPIILEASDSVDISKAAGRLDFITHTDVFSGLYGVMTYEIDKSFEKERYQFFAKVKNVLKKKSSFNNARSPWITILIYVETFLLFGVVAYLVMFKDITMLLGYIDIRVLYILIIGAMHGLRHSLIATGLCITLLFYDYIIKGYSALVLIYDSNILSAVFIFLLAGMALGYLNNQKKLQVHELEKNKEKLSEQLYHLKEMYYDSLKVKDSLQKQIFNSENSYGRVFGMISQLDSLDFNKLKGEIIRVTVDIMGNNSIALYMVGRKEKYMRLLAKSPSLTALNKSVVIKDSPVFQEILQTKKLYINRTISTDVSMVMSAPVIYNDEVIAIIVMYDADISDLTLSYQNLFSITMKLVNQSIVRAYKYQKAQEDEWYIAGTDFLKSEYMLDKILQSMEMQEHGVSHFVLVKIIQDEERNYLNAIPRMIREFDHIGYYKEEILVIFNNTTLQEFNDFVRKRFLESGINTKVLEVI